MSEAQRLQQAELLVNSLCLAKRKREMQQLNRKQAQITGQAQAAVAADHKRCCSLYSAGIGAVGNIGAAFAGKD